MRQVRAMLAAVVTLALGLVAAPAMATAPDVSGVVTEIGGASAPIASIGSAVLLVIVGIKVFKWVRRAM